MTSRIVVIGGGIGGVTAALRLAEAGHQVTVVERGDQLGGLVSSLTVGGTPLECYYHHVFPHEDGIRALIDEVGLGDRLAWVPSSLGVFTAGRLWPFTTPRDLIRFRPLPWRDRLHLGVGALRVPRIKDWRQLDGVSALDWLRRLTGRRATEVIWSPLLDAKFGAAAQTVPAAWMWARLTQRAGARHRGGEQLGYLRGGFRQLFDALTARLVAAGAEIRTGTCVTSVVVTDGRVTGVETTGGSLAADAVLYAGAQPALSPLVPEEHRDPRWTMTAGLGVLCVVVELARPVSDTYWTNVCDPALPFCALVEHTNLMPAGDYGGRHVVYLSRYLVGDEPSALADPAAEAARWVEALRATWPHIAAEDVLAVHPFRAHYAAPLVRIGHASRVTPLRAALPGLYVATTAQIYPDDRGMDQGVKLAERVVSVMRADLTA